MASRGVEVAVFEQNARPYGKIEDGLPRWHVALREKEYEAIGENLSKPGVHFVPRTRVGSDVSIRELASGWGFSGVVLACGAWRDRPLPIEGADAYVGRGLIYQNPFIIWFNHADEPGYRGPVFEPRDGALVVGGGLASIDVVKALMLMTARAKLRERGIEQDLVELEVKGIPKILERHGLAFEQLGLQGCTLFYRRGEADMPLVEMPEDADEKRREKVAVSRGKLLARRWRSTASTSSRCARPKASIVEGDRLVGLRFRRTKIEGSRVVPQPRDVRAPRLLRDLVDRLDPGADRGDPDEGRAVRLPGLGDRTARPTTRRSSPPATSSPARATSWRRASTRAR